MLSDKSRKNRKFSWPGRPSVILEWGWGSDAQPPSLFFRGHSVQHGCLSACFGCIRSWFRALRARTSPCSFILSLLEPHVVPSVVAAFQTRLTVDKDLKTGGIHMIFISSVGRRVFKVWTEKCCVWSSFPPFCLWHPVYPRRGGPRDWSCGLGKLQSSASF